MIVIGLAEQLLVNILGMVYPAFKSVQAIQSVGTNAIYILLGDTDDKQWLTYWIVYSLTLAIDTTFGFALGYIPFYHLLKLVFLVCLFHPQVMGATVVYDKVYLFYSLIKGGSSIIRKIRKSN